MQLRNTTRTMRTTTLMITIAAVSLILFQNCGGGFHPSESLSQPSVAAASSEQPKDFKPYLDPASGVPAKGTSFKVKADLSMIAQGSRVYWDHVLGNGAKYCEQTTSVDKSETVFYCPESGKLSIFIGILSADGNEDGRTLEITVYDSQNADTAGPGPLPTPTELTGAELYATNCAGCHNALPTSTKKRITLTRLNNSIGNSSIPAMNTQTLIGLSAAQRQAIVTALQ